MQDYKIQFSSKTECSRYCNIIFKGFWSSGVCTCKDICVGSVAKKWWKIATHKKKREQRSLADGLRQMERNATV